MGESNRNYFLAAATLVGGIVIGGLAMRAGNAQAPQAGLTRNTVPVAKPVNYETGEPGSAETLVAPSLAEMDDQFADLVETISPSVVNIQVKASNGNAALGQGSGVIYRADGYIVTNDHVVASATGDVTVMLADGREFTGKVTKSGDTRNDIAIVKIDAKDLPVARFADSKRVRPGQYAIAVGSPFGLENTVTIGHISALGRSSVVGQTMQDARSYAGMIQTDAPINPGNSGGPLLNIHGEVVGINSSILSSGAFFGGGGQSAGIGFAIPSNQVKLIADLLITKGKLSRGYLGVLPEALKPFEKSQMKISEGSILREVPENGPAAKAGLQAKDVITRIGDTSVRDEQDLLNAMLKYGPGSSVTVEYVRNGQKKTASVKVGNFPTQAQTMRTLPEGQRIPRRLNPEDGFEMPEMPDIPNLRDFFREDSEQPKAPETTKPEAAKPGGPARLGVQIGDLDENQRKQFNIPSDVKGALVVEVVKGSVADKFGLRAGDVITSLNGKPINVSADILSAMSGKKVGDRGSIEYKRFANGSTNQMALDGFKF